MAVPPTAAEHIAQGRDGRRRKSRHGRPTRLEVRAIMAATGIVGINTPRVRARGSGHYGGWSWVPAFLAEIEHTGVATTAAKVAGISRGTAYARKLKYPAFARLWQAAEQRHAETIDAEIHRRAVEGVDRPVIFKGELMGVWRLEDGTVVAPETPGARLEALTIKEYSDRLLELKARAVMPDKYADRQRLDVRDVREPVDAEIQSLMQDLYELAKLGRGNGGALPRGRAAIEAEVVEQEEGAEGV